MASVHLLRTWVVVLSLAACALHLTVLFLGFGKYKSDIRLYSVACSMGILKIVTLYFEFQNYIEICLFYKVSITAFYAILTTISATICSAGFDVSDNDIWVTFLWASIAVIADGLLSSVQFLGGLDAAVYYDSSPTSSTSLSKGTNIFSVSLERTCTVSVDQQRGKKITKDSLESSRTVSVDRRSGVKITKDIKLE